MFKQGGVLTTDLYLSTEAQIAADTWTLVFVYPNTLLEFLVKGNAVTTQWESTGQFCHCNDE